jgi:hypothetical protein
MEINLVWLVFCYYFKQQPRELGLKEDWASAYQD